MKSTGNHIIHKQTIEVRFRDLTAAHRWDAANQVKTTEAVRKSIEQCFQDFDSINEYLAIDRLELDLGAFSIEHLFSKMPEKLYHELHKVLNSYRMDHHEYEEAEIIEDVSSRDIWRGVDNGIVSPIVKNSEVTAFLSFLQHGYLPWWYSREPSWDIEWLQKLTRVDWLELGNFLNADQGNDFYDERAISRLIFQFSDGFLTSLLKGLQLKEPVEKAWSWLADFYLSIRKIETNYYPEGSFPSLSILRKHFWKKWIGYALGKSALPELTDLIAPLKQPYLITSLFMGEGKYNELPDNIPEFWRNELIRLTHIGYNGKTASDLNTGLINNTEYNGKPGSGINAELDRLAEIEEFKETQKADTIVKDDFILIPDAGLVLLHPFLRQLFVHFHWLDEHEFVNDKARSRAVYLLHYLAAGNEDAPEYVLTLPKLLCGISPEWPLEPALPLTDAEKEDCDEMLIQVIGHWTALRNTSPAGMREAFLWRQGKLSLTDEGWRLVVQRKTEDILLNHLPWGFSMVKFSWMPRILTVSWE